MIYFELWHRIISLSLENLNFCHKIEVESNQCFYIFTFIHFSFKKKEEILIPVHKWRKKNISRKLREPSGWYFVFCILFRLLLLPTTTATTQIVSNVLTFLFYIFHLSHSYFTLVLFVKFFSDTYLRKKPQKKTKQNQQQHLFIQWQDMSKSWIFFILFCDCASSFFFLHILLT